MDFEDFFRAPVLPLAVCDGRGRLLRSNERAAALWECAPEALCGRQLRQLVAGEDVGPLTEVLHIARQAPGSAPAIDLTLAGAAAGRTVRLTAFAGGGAGGAGELLLVLEDRREITALQERVAHLAGIDPLTGLPNRFQLQRRLEATVAAAEGQTPFCLFLLSLNRFQEVNDSFGHETGDRVLAEVAGRLHAALPPGGYLARSNGVRFVLVAPAPARAAALFQDLARRVAAPLAVAGETLCLTLRGGISSYPADGTHGRELLQKAEAALHQVAERLTSACCRYSPEIRRRARSRLVREGALRTALEREQFLLHYQPVVDAASRAVTGVEALLRWQHPERGMLQPADFLPDLEAEGLGETAGFWILERVCAQARAWHGREVGPLRTSVNLLADHLRAPDFTARLERTLGAAGLPADELELEITERLLLAEEKLSARVLGELGELGVRVAIDDFGTGYSSLSRLQSLPVQTLKIDRSFIGDLPHSAQAAGITTAIINLARSLGLQVTAEGVETADQLAFLHGMRCNGMQGYLIARPMPAADLALWVRRKEHRPRVYPSPPDLP